MTRTGVGAPEPDPDRDYRWLDTTAAAELLGVSVRELMAIVDRGELPAYRIDGQVRLRRADVERLRELRQRANGAGP